jgi:cytochrome P450
MLKRTGLLYRSAGIGGLWSSGTMMLMRFKILSLLRHAKGCQSLVFGYGIHACLGAALYRMKTQVALSQPLKRFPRMQRLTDKCEYDPVHFFRALKSLSVAVNA